MAKCRLFAKLLLLLMLICSMILPGKAAQADMAADYDILHGHFYTQAAGRDAAQGTGYTITDEGMDSRGQTIRFWSEFQRLGGVAALGYPASQRFMWDGYVCQVMQRAVLQWRPEANTVYFVNVMDLITAAGKDDFLLSARQTPPPADFFAEEQGLSFEQIKQKRYALLDSNPAIKAKFFSVADPLNMNGLPTAPITDMGDAYVLRAQRVIIQEWKKDVPWAKAGDVTVALGGDIAKETGLIAAQDAQAVATVTPPAPVVRKHIIALDPGHGGDEIGASMQLSGGRVVLEKDANLQIALRAARLLRDAGYTVVLTRDSDTRVNVPPRDLNGNGQIDVDDDLQARADIANAAGAELLISIHNNGSNDPGRGGTEVYYCGDAPAGGQGKLLAQLLSQQLGAHLQASGYATTNRGAIDDAVLGKPYGHLFMLGKQTPRVARPPRMPAALVENLYVSNPTEAALLTQDRTLDALAAAIRDAVVAYMER